MDAHVSGCGATGFYSERLARFGGSVGWPTLLDRVRPEARLKPGRLVVPPSGHHRCWFCALTWCKQLQELTTVQRQPMLSHCLRKKKERNGNLSGADGAMSLENWWTHRGARTQSWPPQLQLDANEAPNRQAPNASHPCGPVPRGTYPIRELKFFHRARERTADTDTQHLARCSQFSCLRQQPMITAIPTCCSFLPYTFGTFTSHPGPFTFCHSLYGYANAVRHSFPIPR